MYDLKGPAPSGKLFETGLAQQTFRFGSESLQHRLRYSGASVNRVGYTLANVLVYRGRVYNNFRNGVAVEKSLEKSLERNEHG